MNTATVYEVRISKRDRIRLLLATCDRCARDVQHGGGFTSQPIILDSRVAHCGCPGSYDLVLAPGVAA